MKQAAPWTEAEIALLRSQYPVSLTEDLALRMGRTPNALHLAARKHGIRKTEQMLRMIAAVYADKTPNPGRFSARHGHAHPGNRTYNIWFSMKARCTKPSHISYADYGGRGIRVCDEWMADFSNFLRDMGEAPDGKTLGRINNDGPYEPSNCQWETMAEQQRNRRSCRPIEAFGRRQLLVCWSEETGIKSSTIAKRLAKGWTPEEALSIRVGDKAEGTGA